MWDEKNSKDLYRWMGTIDTKTDNIIETVGGLVEDFRGFEKETRTHRETVEARLSVGSTKFISFRERIERLELKNGIKNNKTFITWKWVVEKLWQPVLIAIVVLVITELAK